MFPRLFQAGPLEIATYGAFVAAGYLLGILWLRSEREGMGLSEDRFWELAYALFAGAVLGGKLLFVGLNWDDFAAGRIRLLADFRYGFVFYGGVLGAMAVGALWVRSRGESWLKLADYFGVALPMGHALGRLGCLAAGCCYGKPTDAFWAVRYTDPRSLVPEGLLGVGTHPAQVYEAAGNAALAWVLLKALRRVQAGRLPAGTVFIGYLVLYAAVRFGVEFFRGDDRGPAPLGLYPSQWIALATMAAGAAWLRRAVPGKKHRRRG